MKKNTYGFPQPVIDALLNLRAKVVRVEEMGPHFVKYHLDSFGVLHHLREPDTGDAHDHPWPFYTTILYGGYMEREFRYDEKGNVTESIIERKVGESHLVKAETIHQIINLPAGESYTLVQPGTPSRKSGFYKFDGWGVWHRFWDETTFQLQVSAR